MIGTRADRQPPKLSSRVVNAVVETWRVCGLFQACVLPAAVRIEMIHKKQDEQARNSIPPLDNAGFSAFA